MDGKTTGSIIAVIVVLLGGWYLFFRAPAGAPTVQAPETSGETSSSNVTVAYSGEGFSLASATVPLGATVTFVNRSGDQMWVGSSMHPDHVSYDGTTRAEHCIAGYSGPVPFDQCAAGDTFSFTFTKAGTWRYHNHANAAHFGSIIVTETAAP